MNYTIEKIKDGEEGYFVLNISEDGDISFEKKTKEGIFDMINDNPEYYMDEIYDGRTIIIKGKCVVPTPKEVAIKYELE